MGRRRPRQGRLAQGPRHLLREAPVVLKQQSVSAPKECPAAAVCRQSSSCGHRGAVTAHQVDREQLGLVRQSDTYSAIIAKVESTVLSCGVDDISRYACCGVAGQRQLAQNPIIERTRGQGAVRTGVEAHLAVAAQQDSVLHDRWRDHACPRRERARRFFFVEEMNAQTDVGRGP